MSDFACGSERRRRLVTAAAETQTINGIDRVEVDPADQRRLHVHFLAGHGLEALSPDTVAIDGGERITGLRVVTVATSDTAATVTVSQPGDFSHYTLRLRTSPTDDRVPAPFDTRLAAVVFSFKAACPNPFDCAHQHVCPPAELDLPDIDHLAKDYDSFRRLMLDRMAVTAPSWTERSPADVMVTLVELLAAVADEQSYTQDAIGTEAYLGTARLRRSVARHARLLGYRAHNGCNARTFVQFTATDDAPAGGVTIPSDSAVSTGRADPPAGPDPPAAGATVFRTLHPVTVRPGHHALAFHTWSEEVCCLPVGATTATLRARLPGGGAVHVTAGDLLLLKETVDPGSLAEADADPEHRQVVRVVDVTPGTDQLDGTEVLQVRWHPDDTLTIPLCVSVRDESGQAAIVGVAATGVAVAEHAQRLSSREPVPDHTPDPAPSALPRPYRPRLADGPVTFRHAYTATAPAAAQLHRDPHTAGPDIVVHLDGQDWTPSPAGDLLASSPQDRHVTVETEDDGSAWLRFGDGVYGRRPPDDTAGVRVDHAVGNGSGGNVGREVLRRVQLGVDAALIQAVENPLPAAGGTDPEPTARIRLSAPEAVRVPDRAVTADDYETMLLRHELVQRAHADLRWTGSWYTVFVAVDLVGGRLLDAATEQMLRRHLDRYRMAGHDLELTGPRLVPVELHLQVCAAPDAERRDVEARLVDRLSSRRLPDGTVGLFHPDNFSFGDPLYLSAVYAAALQVAGIDSLVATRFRRFGRASAGELTDEVLQPAEQEIIQLANDPNFPERGRLELDVRGGR